MHVPECMYVQHMVTDVMQSEDVRCPGTKVTGNYELPSVVLGTEPRFSFFPEESAERSN